MKYYNIESKRKSSNINYYKNKISKDELYNYYVKENHNYKETLNHFKILNNNLYNKLLIFYGIKKKL